MQQLAKNLKEYAIVQVMSGVSDTLAPRIIAKIGDIRRFHSGSALVTFAGIDAPPYQSGKINITSRHISKRCSSSLRRTGYEIVQCIKINKPSQDNVYTFMLKNFYFLFQNRCIAIALTNASPKLLVLEAKTTPSSSPFFGGCMYASPVVATPIGL